MMFRFAPLALLFVPVLSSAQDQPATSPNPLSLEDRTALRCAAAFAIVANGQKRGDETALAHPPLGERGREFLVRTSARIMDETGTDRAALATILRAQAQSLWDKGETDEVMPACLLLLEASGL